MKTILAMMAGILLTTGTARGEGQSGAATPESKASQTEIAQPLEKSIDVPQEAFQRKRCFVPREVPLSGRR